MRRHTLPFIVTSNIFLLFPMAAAVYMGEWVYFFFSFCIFIASVGFHYTFYFNKKDFSLTRFIFKKTKYKSMTAFRISDWSLATIGALYVGHYIYTSPADPSLKLVLGLLFLSSLIFFICTFAFGNYNKYHPWFHVSVQTVLGFIVLFL